MEILPGFSTAAGRNFYSTCSRSQSWTQRCPPDCLVKSQMLATFWCQLQFFWPSHSFTFTQFKSSTVNEGFICLFFIAIFQFSSVAQSCPTLCDPIDCSTPGFHVHHQLVKLAQTHVYWAGDAIQSSHPLSSPSPLAFSLAQHQGLFKWVSASHQVAKILEFQL